VFSSYLPCIGLVLSLPTCRGFLYTAVVLVVGGVEVVLGVHIAVLPLVVVLLLLVVLLCLQVVLPHLLVIEVVAEGLVDVAVAAEVAVSEVLLGMSTELAAALVQ